MCGARKMYSGAAAICPLPAPAALPLGPLRSIGIASRGGSSTGADMNGPAPCAPAAPPSSPGADPLPAAWRSACPSRGPTTGALSGAASAVPVSPASAAVTALSARRRPAVRRRRQITLGAIAWASLTLRLRCRGHRPPQVDRRDRAVWHPALAELPHRRRGGGLRIAIMQPHRAAQAKVLAGQHIETAEVEDKEHLRRPAPYARHRFERRRNRLVIGALKARPIEHPLARAQRKLARVAHLGGREPGAAQQTRVGLKQLHRGGQAVAEARFQTPEDRARQRRKGLARPLCYPLLPDALAVTVDQLRKRRIRARKRRKRRRNAWAPRGTAATSGSACPPASLAAA